MCVYRCFYLWWVIYHRPIYVWLTFVNYLYFFYISTGKFKYCVISLMIFVWPQSSQSFFWMWTVCIPTISTVWSSCTTASSWSRMLTTLSVIFIITCVRSYWNSEWCSLHQFLIRSIPVFIQQAIQRLFINPGLWKLNFGVLTVSSINYCCTANLKLNVKINSIL